MFTELNYLSIQFYVIFTQLLYNKQENKNISKLRGSDHKPVSLFYYTW